MVHPQTGGQKDKESVIFLTAISTGFYVNRSTRTSFDPAPASSPHFSHELLFSLIGAVPTFAMAWSDLVEQIRETEAAAAAAAEGQGGAGGAGAKLLPSAPANALENYANIFRLGRGRGDGEVVLRGLLPFSWLACPPTAETAGHYHKIYDIGAAMDEVGDTFGVDDSQKGQPREW